MQDTLIESFRLSPQQRHLCAMQRVEEPFPFHTYYVAQLAGRLDVSRFYSALEQLVERHEILRTSFPCLPGLKLPVQVINAEIHLPLVVHDYRSNSPSKREEALRQLREDVANQSFTLRDGPLWLVTLVLCEYDRQLLLLNMSGLCADAKTCQVLLHELSQLYMQSIDEEAQTEESLQYADLAEWQYELLESADTEQGREYWQALEHTMLKDVALPYERPIDHHAPFTRRSLSINLSPAEYLYLQPLAQELAVSPSAVLLTCWGIVLSRLSGQSSFPISSGYSGRAYEELNEAVGLLAKFLPLSYQFSEDAAFSDIVRQVEDIQREAEKWQAYFDWSLFETLKGQEQEPFAAFGFDYETLPASWQAGSLLWAVETQQICLERFNLRLSCLETAQGMQVTLHYDTGKFAQQDMQRLLQQWQTVLQQVLVSSDAKLGLLQLLTYGEQQQILHAWNATQAEYPQDKCLHQLFEMQVGRTPHSIAAVYADEHVSYQILNTQANQVARYLRLHGVGPEVRVGICMERSLDLLIALLGILKAGGAYVPCDPSYPSERLAFMLQDANIPLLLTQEHLLKQLPATTCEVVCLDTTSEIFTGDFCSQVEGRANVDQLAYVLYTSGSTGQPKGVMVPHRGLVNYLFWAVQTYAVPGEYSAYGAPLHSPIGFDLTVTSLFVPLLTGRSVLLLSEDEGVAALGSTLCNNDKLTLTKVTPAHLEALNHLVTETSFAASTQVLIIGGEALWQESLALWRQYAPRTRLINEYGPTETVVGCCVYEVPPLPYSVSTSAVPIGKPIANMQMYVLNTYLQPVPIGVSGELYVGGVGVTRGYINRPEQTAERFIPHPFSSDPGARLYRTGDLARYLPSGDLEYIGRVDQQVKIHGFRIELGEIEAQLRQHPDIQECAVLAREDIPGNKRLVTYVVLRHQQALRNSNIRAYLQDHLPSYMIPAVFVPLNTLPLTSNGKVDRKKLPAIDAMQTERAEEFAAPRTSVEETLVNIWSQVLRREQIGIHDNFFALGGDSILSIQVVTRAKQAGLQMAPRQLFQYQSIAQLSGIITSSVAPQAEQALVTGPAPLTPIQRWFFARNLPVPHHFNQAILLETQQTLRPVWLQRALLQLVLHHDALRLRFVQQADGWRSEIAEPASHSPFFLCIDISALTDQDQQSAMVTLTEEAQTSIDLSTGMLLRALFFVRGSENTEDLHPSGANLGRGGTSRAPSDPPTPASQADSRGATGRTRGAAPTPTEISPEGYADRLLLIVHHLAVDGVSWRILLEDLQSLCTQLYQEEQPQLAAKTTSWKEWAQQLQQYAQTKELRTTQNYWLASSRKHIEHLPVDMREGENTIATSETLSVTLSTQQTQALLQEVPSAYHTQINDVLLTALTQTFATWTGQSRLLVDLEGHGREDSNVGSDLDLSRTIGWFTTLFPLLLDIEQATQPGEALKSIKEQLRQVPQKGLSYGVLRYLSTDSVLAEQLAKLPQAQVLFNYFGQLDAVTYEQTLFRPAPASTGPVHSKQEPRSHLFEINGQIADGELRMTWRYSREVHHHETVQMLAQRFIKCLEDIIAHCQSLATSEHTPSDFPLVALSQQQLDMLTKQVPSEQQIEDIYPLSPMQAGLLFHCLYAPQSAVYCGYFGWTIQGPFHADAWRWSWQQVINRHPILRTLFLWQGLPEPLQVVCSQVEVPWTMHDWRSLSTQERQYKLDTFRKQEELVGFDLQQAPLLRLSLIRLEEQTYYFHLGLHHLLLDGWSQALLIGEVQAYYLSYKRTKNISLAPVRPYRDYIAWLQQQDMQQAQQFWHSYLAGFTTPTKLAVDNQPFAGRAQSNRIVDIEQRAFSTEMAATLQEVCKRHQLTLNTVMQGAWALLLSRYSGEVDVLFGATVAGRPAELIGIETMVGIFINTLPVRVQCEQDVLLLSWLTQLQASQSEVRQYEYTPLVDIQRWSEVPIEQPLFDSLLLFQNYPLDPMKKDDEVEEADESELTIQGKRSVEYTNYALTLKAAVSGNTLALQLAYDTSRFDAPTVARFMDHLQIILEAIALHPQQRLADLPLLTATERHTVLVEWNATQRSFAADMSVHELFERQVTQTPDAIALVFQDTCVTYDFVNAAATRVASHLQALGIEAGIPIGLCVERSLEQVVGMLGILKFGGAYVPLDPAYPHDRLSFMLEDSHAAALVTQPWLLEIFSEQPAPVLLLADAMFASTHTTLAPRKCSAEQLAYLIYTSGSTGRPKGTMISHRAVGNFFTSMSQRPGMTANDHILAVTSFSFDIAALELLLPLTLGARVHIASQQVLTDGTELAALVEASGATLLQATPVTWRMLLSAQWMGSHLKMLCGGEALPIELALELQQRGGELWNMYGPTETTIWSAIEDVSRAEKHISIGRAIDNTQLYVLDGQGSPVPIGVVGELYIAGEGVAYGYWQRPDLSAERFLPDPFSQQAGARMYRTGDRARWLVNGTLECLGRMDQQVKLRGYRIELSEIEAVLRDHPAVQEAVVVLREESATNRYLAAYIVAQAGMSPTHQELQQHLRRRLPDYMIPTAFLSLESFPLTPNGKINRKALPTPDLSHQSTEFVAPETPLQEQLSAIWTELLHLPSVSIHHNFFALGGNSLLATRLMMHIRTEFLVEVPLRSLFEAQTIAELALVIEHIQDELIIQAMNEDLLQIDTNGVGAPFTSPFAPEINTGK